MTYDELLEEQSLERAAMIQQAMVATGHNLARAARLLDIQQPRLYGLLSRAPRDSALGVIWRDYRKSEPKRGRR